MARRPFRDLPLRRKLTLVYVFTSGLALLVAAAAFLTFELDNFRDELVQNTLTQADIVGYNAASALLFSDREAAGKTLAALRAESRIVAAGIYTADGAPFATYVQAGGPPPEAFRTLPDAGPERWHFTDAGLVVSSPIVLDGEVVGSVRLLAGLTRLNALMLQHSLIVLVVFVLSFAVSLPLLSRLQRVISGPIMHLVEQARVVTTEHNYGVRAARTSADELGLLVDTFNEMLEQIQARDAALAGARDSAERANRAKDEFLAVVSHELRTPLTPILAWARMLGQGRLEPADLTRAAEIIERNAKSQAQLIEDLLDVSRIITGKLRLELERVDPAVIVETAVESVRPTADLKGVRLRMALDPQAGAVRADVERLKQVIWNLLSNAVKFTPAGGDIEVRLRRTDRHLEIAVADTGEGIEPAFLPYVFERFRQADGAASTRTHSGLGLGLAIVRHLTELHGGTVRADSAGPGRGATFTVALPLAVPARSAAEPAALPRRSAQDPLVPPALPPQPELSGLRILAVDDDADTRETIRVLLEQQGAVVRTAESAAEGVALIEEWTPDLIISDIGMPHEDGNAFIRRVRERPPEAGGQTPALALTAFARVEDRLSSLSSGFQMHVAKPIEPAELIAVTAALANWRAPKSKNAVGEQER